MHALIQAIQRQKFLATQKMQAFAHHLRTHGWRQTVQYYGVRVFFIIFICYLVRDLTLYVFIPWLVARSLWR